MPAYQGYGLTECGSVVGLNRPGDDGDGVGRPLPHVRVVIRDDEIHIASRAFCGYLGDALARPGYSRNSSLKWRLSAMALSTSFTRSVWLPAAQAKKML